MANFLTLIKKLFLFPIAVIFSTTVVIGIIVFYFPLLIICMMYKGVIVVLSKFVLPGSEMLGALENLLANGKVYTDKSMYVILNTIYEGRVDIEKYIKHWDERIIKQKLGNGKLKYPELQCYVETWMGYSFYRQDKTFDLRRHFTLHDNNNLPVDRRKFNKIRNKHVNELFPAKRSPWEIIIINDFQKDDIHDGKEYSIVMFKYHHCLADGYATLKLTFEFYGHDIPQLSTPNMHFRNFLQKSLMLVFSFLHFVFLLGEIPFYLIYNPSEKVFDINSWHKPIKQKDLDLVVWSVKPFKTDIVKEISVANKVNISAVLMAACSGAFRRLMEAKLLKSPKEIFTAVSFNLPNPPEGLRSHSFGVRFNIPISGRHLTSKQRLSQIDNKMTTRVGLGITIFAPVASLMLKYLPVALSGPNKAKLMQTMNFSSVPLPSKEVILNNWKLVACYVHYEITEFNNSFTASNLKYHDEFFVTCGIQRTLLSNEDEVSDIEKYLFEELNSLRSSSHIV